MSFVLLTNGQVEEICKLNGTTSKQLTEDVKILRQWLKTQLHLPQIAGDDLLRAFILGCNNSIEKAKLKLDKFYTIRNEMQEIFLQRDPLDDKFVQTAQAKTIFPLPQLTDKGHRVFISTNTVLDPDEHDVVAYIQRALATIEICLKQYPYSTGEEMIVDGHNFSFSHAVKITPKHMYSLLHCCQAVFPIKIKSIIFINAPPAVDFVVTRLLKPFLKDKIAKRIFIYQENHEVLYDHYPKEMLPYDYGGNAESIKDLNKLWLTKLQNERDYFLTEARLSSNESKRVGNNFDAVKFSQTMFGTNGTFKKLNLD